MESLAYIHSALAYESNDPAPALRPCLQPKGYCPSSAWLAAPSLLVSLVLLNVSHPSFATIRGVVSTPGGPINVRSQPNGQVVESLSNGTPVELTGIAENGWLERTDGTWLYAPFVETMVEAPTETAAEDGAIASSEVSETAETAETGSESAEAEAVSPSRRIAFANTGGASLNVRDEPGGSVVSVVPDGSQLELTGRAQAGWFEKADGTWVSAQLVRSTPPQGGAIAPSPATPETDANSGASPEASPEVPTASPPVAAEQVGVVETEGNPLNVRNAPSPDEESVVGRLQNGDRIELTGNSQDGFLERTDGTWVMAQFVRTDTPVAPNDQATSGAPAESPNAEASAPSSDSPTSPAPSSQPIAAAPQTATEPDGSGTTGIVTTGGGPLNVRREPSANSLSISTLPDGSQLELTGRRENGYLERTNGTWVAEEFVSLAEAGTAPATAPAPTTTVPEPTAPEPAATTPPAAAPAAAPPSASQPAQGGTVSPAVVQTNGSPLNVRNAPGGAVIASLPNGTRVELTGRTSGGWSEQSNGTWLSSQWLSSNPSNGSGNGVGSDVQTSFVRTNGSPLNVRNAPGGKVIGGLANGAPVELTGRSNGEWVERSNSTWISSRWLSAAPNGVGSDVQVGFVRTNGSPLLVRMTPGGSIIGEVANGSQVELTGRSTAGWLQLSNNGWISGDWVVL